MILYATTCVNVLYVVIRMRDWVLLPSKALKEVRRLISSMSRTLIRLSFLTVRYSGLTMIILINECSVDSELMFL